jgi:hypothetical protein
VATAARLPELATVSWRPLADDAYLRRQGRLWTLSTSCHVVPFLITGAGLLWLNLLAAPVAIVALLHAWIIPELYALRGANVVRAKSEPDNPVAQGLLGDLLGHDARELQRTTGLALERGELGTWLVGQAGALLLRDKRCFCFCIKADDPSLPPSDRIAHLILALRTDERGFATVANLAFAGAPWRVRRRLEPGMRNALDTGRRISVRTPPQPSNSG